MVRENKVKQKLKNGEAVIGTFVKTVDPSVIEILGCSGMEFFVIDSEHVSYNPETITDLVRASDLTGIVPIVRVREATAVNIMQALDTGALGYHAPNVDTPEQARIAVDAGRYTPLGNRGFAPTHRAANYGMMDKQEYIDKANKEILTIIHCETMESLGNLDEILKLEELDVVFIGPMDLSQSLGRDVMGQRNHPKLLEAIDQIIEKVNKAGKAVGTVADNAQMAKELMEKYPDLKMIAGMNEYSSVGAARAVKEAEAKDRIATVGIDSSQEAVQLMEQGVFKAFVVQKAFKMGYLGVKETILHLEGKKEEKNIDSGCELITPENMYNSEMEKLLFPFNTKKNT